MYINQIGNEYSLCPGKSESNIAHIKKPLIIENKKETALNVTSVVISDECIRTEYSLPYFTVSERITHISEGLFVVERDWCNLDRERKIQLVFEVETCFLPTKYLIPGVLYNGNHWGKGKEPKGLAYNGRPWIFAYDRQGIPSCTITENKDVALSVFASDEDVQSLQSSCSLIKTDKGTFRQRIYYPVIESPLTYSSRDTYSEEYMEYITIKPGEHYKTKAYILVSKPRWENYGLVATYDRALDIFGMYKSPVLKPSEVWNLGIKYANRLLIEHEGRRLFVIGLSPDNNDGYYVQRKHFEIGWCGQNALYARLLIKDYIINNNKESLDKGIAVLDTWVEETQRENGLFYVHFEKAMGKEDAIIDTCNLGFGASEIAKSYVLLKSIGINKPRYLDFAVCLCNFFVENYNEDYGFGKSWSLSGQCIDPEGTIGSYIILPMIEVYKITKDDKYIKTAEKAMHFYHDRDLKQFICKAGALDTYCIDKESSGPLLIAAIALYKLTNNEVYLEYAEKAAYYFLSWTYHYDVIYSDDSDFKQYGITTAGGTSVSVQHHHIDPWGGLIVPELLELSELTNDKKWKIRALSIWSNCLLGITTDDNAVICGRKRPLGSQNEAFYQCRWGEYGCESRGRINHWLVAWPGAFRLSTLDKVEDWTIFEKM